METFDFDADGSQSELLADYLEIIEEDSEDEIDESTLVEPDRSTNFRPGTAGKIQELRRRADAGMRLWHPQDEKDLSRLTADARFVPLARVEPLTYYTVDWRKVALTLAKSKGTSAVIALSDAPTTRIKIFENGRPYYLEIMPLSSTSRFLLIIDSTESYDCSEIEDRSEWADAAIWPAAASDILNLERLVNG